MPYRKYPLNSEELRRLAQERLAQQACGNAPALSLEQAQRLIDALRISLIERDLQSEHMEASRAQLEMSPNQNGEIYVLAPVGHFSLDGAGDMAAHVLLRMATLPDGQGCQMVLTDISDRRLIEEALRVSEECWKLALDASGDGVWDWNVRTGAVMFSQRFAQLYGFEGDEYGNSLEDWSTRIHPDEKLRVMADIQAHLAGETPSFSNEHRGHCKDGR